MKLDNQPDVDKLKIEKQIGSRLSFAPFRPDLKNPKNRSASKASHSASKVATGSSTKSDKSTKILPSKTKTSKRLFDEVALSESEDEDEETSVGVVGLADLENDLSSSDESGSASSQSSSSSKIDDDDSAA
jgi:hypothetical protein